MPKLPKYTIRCLRNLLDKREVSSVEITEAYINEISKHEKNINAFITVSEETAIKEAEKADMQKSERVLHGIPYAVKDNICTRGIRTTCASKILEDFIPCYDATVITKMKEQGSPMLGKLNMDEFAMGNSNETSLFGAVRNPVNTDYVSGGSSGGGAAAVSGELTPFAICSDTGGSIRQPAAFCGAVGMKPTYGTVSRFGLVAFASSLDQIGVISRNVYDNAMILTEIAGKDYHDSTSLSARLRYNYCAGIERSIKGMKIALPVEVFSEAINSEVKESVLTAAKVFEELGAEVCEAGMPALKYALPAYYIISSAEASSNLARYDGVKYGYRSESYRNIDEMYTNTRKYGFGSEVKRRILLGTFALSSGYFDEYYKKAIKAKKLIEQEYSKLLSTYDIVLTPTTPNVAFKLGQKINPVEKYREDIFTVSANLAGLPAMSVPCGINSIGLPIGMQLIGKPFSESTLYRAGFAYETFIKETVK